MTRVLVTGGTGYVGRFIVEGLLAEGCEVTVAGRTAPDEGMFSKPVGFRPFDLDPQTELAPLFDDIDHCVHAAFHHVAGKYRGGEGDDPTGFLRRNAAGSAALFLAGRSAGVKRTVFLSSRAVYGQQEAGAQLCESMTCLPDTLYGQIKLQAEDALAGLASERFIAASLRVTGVYGQPRPGAAHKWQGLFADYLAGKAIEPRAGTEVHGRDLATAVWRMLCAPADEVNGKIFNVSDLLVDHRDLLRLVQSAKRVGHLLPERARSLPNAVDTTKLRRLGWSPGGVALLRESVRSALFEHEGL
ncbi:NAD-dependent epimerase/dehydratase family protein [Pararhizobium haloflavum]|uniref:NAD-dependent epimerase/dehydratase family protein n=1 Tax=Pararhizobium haloflavum TaxID=2037914 RepID=UPI000C19830E|nr:SDR family oxidoreductase [Pararhizobium haloflavum]